MRLGSEDLVEPRGGEVVEQKGGEGMMSWAPGWEWVRGTGGRKVERMWCRLWSVAERGEFWRRDERKEGGARGGGGKKARELESVSVGPGTGHPVVFGNSFVKRRRNVKEPGGSKL